MAYAATEPAAGSDLAALRTTAERVDRDGGTAAYKLNGRKQWISNGGLADVYTVLANAPGGPSWFIVEKGTTGLSHGKPEDKHGIRASNTAAVSVRGRRGRRRPPGRRRRRPGPAAGPGRVRLHAPDGRRLRPRRRLGGARARHRLLGRPHPGRRAAGREARLHAQADRAARRAPGDRARLHRGDRGAHRRRRRRPDHRGRDRQVPRQRGRQRRRRRRHPGARRLRLHEGVHGREVQARRAHHHHLRGHLRDHGDDHQPRPLAAPPQDARPALPRPGARSSRRCTQPRRRRAPTSPRSPCTPWRR